MAATFVLSPLLTIEVRAYLARMPVDHAILFPQVNWSSTCHSLPYAGWIGRDAFAARLNRLLAKVFGEVDGHTRTHNYFFLSIVHAYRAQASS